MKTFYSLIFFVLFLLVLPSVLFSQTITNVKFYQDSKKVIINYDLVGADENKEFDVNVEMSEDEGLTFSPTPKTLSGDIGKSIKPGKGKRIIWDVLKDLSELQGSKIVFKVIAFESGTEATPATSNISNGSISPWIWIGGGVVVAGGVAAILLSSKKESTVPDLPDNSGIKWPPR